MTENEIREEIKELHRKAKIFENSGYATAGISSSFKKSAKVIEILLNEIQQYIAIGTIEEFKAIKQWKSDVMEGFCKYDASSFEEIADNARNKAIDDFAERLHELCGYEENDFQYPYLLHESRIDETVEQMKGEEYGR